MARKGIFQRLRDAYEGVVETVQNLFKRGAGEVSTDADIPPTQVPEPIETQASETTSAPERTAEDNFPVEIPDPYADLTPEEIEDLEVDDVQIMAPSEFGNDNLRRIFATLAEADAYASEIPVPTIVFKRSTDLLYQVAVDYP